MLHFLQDFLDGGSVNNGGVFYIGEFKNRVFNSNIFTYVKKSIRSSTLRANF